MPGKTENLKIGVVGGGAWGTALASVAARSGTMDNEVTLWARETVVVHTINSFHENQPFLPGIPLPENVHATTDMADLSDMDAILLVCPAQFMRTVTQDLFDHIPASTPLVICAKGIERGTHALMTEVLKETVPDNPLAVLSGPSFAEDVAKGLPTAVTLAASDEKYSELLLNSVGIKTFRPYFSTDVIGAQIGGAAKNVLAIACGIADGCGFGDSSRAALTARGFAEMQRLGLALGAKQSTLSGLSGLGDLILTCNSRLSRNNSLGVALGQGRGMNELMEDRKTVVEGVPTAEALRDLAARHRIDMPIATAVDGIVNQGRSVEQTIEALLDRPFRPEAE